MPVYEYECAACGPFTAMRPMADFEAPCDCPDCGAEAPRVLITAPAIGAMNRSSFLAHATNERSAHEPRRSSGHGAGCSCCSGKSLTLKGARGQGSGSGDGAARGAARAAATRAAKSFPSARPWMISH
ncbi:FmdB family zinc ribbon protein [Chelatococcus asaccharovorans]|uniref:FmdB family zinc ribbon protein n=2 Tax=Chelatococcus asaccharovorans TaxID=28210 RepID=UPI00224C755F|nr:zinc ribbon domain-containing protein [Chelatococcus asaccharovorans]CAH1655262.1 putative regulatory protein, FmdB family [Chelatococcus asaccharovorans]CAH1685479.1 putative regulatory protein, FmdB family [Chelatococcus asaccharovorans]